jgi:hypothetical protein
VALGLTSAIFITRCDAAENTLRERVDRLIEFYVPLNIERVSVTRLPHLSLVVGELCFTPPSRAAARRQPDARWADAVDACLLWGGPAPAWLDGPRLLRADDGELRSLDGTLATFAADRNHARLVTGCSGASALFAARSARIEAWSSHAVAAGYLAHGAVSVDASRLPEFFAAEFVGAGRTQLAGVTEVAAATDIEFREQTVSVRSYWPPEERFARLPETAANAAAESALLESLESRLSEASDLELGLTAGADSRVVGVAMHELGLEFQAMTIAPNADAPDARGAAAVARALQIAHRVYGYELVPDNEAASLIDAEVRWSEGLAPLNGLGWAESGTPAIAVIGAGGETGRAWYYRWQARNYRNPGANQLRRVLRHLHWRIEGATLEAHERLDSAISAWLGPPQEAGHSGWRILDVVYETERLRRWGRTRLPRVTSPVVYALSTPPLTRALISLPLRERISDGFHRRFVAKRAPGIALDAAPTQRRGVPAVLRRLSADVRHRRGLDPAARSPWFLNEIWSDRPLNRGYIADGVLSSELLRSSMGSRWADGVRTGFLAGEAHATEIAFLATGISALDVALKALR